jgi:hypothetical protein
LREDNLEQLDVATEEVNQPFDTYDIYVESEAPVAETHGLESE